MKPLHRSIVAVAALALLTGASHAQPKPQQMRLSVTAVEDSHYGALMTTFAAEVAKRTDGRIQIMNFYAGALGGEREALEAVQLGTQELTLTSSGPIPNFVPETRILDVPFLFRDYHHARTVLDGEIGLALLAKFEPKGIKALGWCDNGFRHMTNNRRAIHTPADLKGLKLRTMENPIHIQAYKAFGVTATPMSFTELFTAMQQGTVDGQENPLSVIYSSKFDQVQKHLSLTGHAFSPCVLVINKQLWDGLPEADQQALQAAARAGIAANRARVDQDEREVIAILRQNGMEVVENIDQSLFLGALSEVYKTFSQQLGQSNLDAIQRVQ